MLELVESHLRTYFKSSYWFTPLVLIPPKSHLLLKPKLAYSFPFFVTWEWLKMIHEPLYPIGTVITAFRALAVAFRALVAVFRALVFHCIVIAHEVQSLPIAPLGGTFANTRGLAGGISSSRMHTCCNWNLIELCISKTNISFYPQVWAVTWPFSHCHFVRCPLLVCDSSSEASLVLLSPVISMAISRSPSTGAGSLVQTSTPASESSSSLKTEAGHLPNLIQSLTLLSLHVFTAEKYHLRVLLAALSPLCVFGFMTDILSIVSIPVCTILWGLVYVWIKHLMHDQVQMQLFPAICVVQILRSFQN